MIIFKQNVETRATFIVANKGNPITDLLGGISQPGLDDVIQVWYSKCGDGITKYNLLVEDFIEISPVHMPGVYSFRIDASLTDEEGELLFSFSGPTFDTYVLKGLVQTTNISGLEVSLATLTNSVAANHVSIQNQISSESGTVQTKIGTDTSQIFTDLSQELSDMDTRLDLDHTLIMTELGSNLTQTISKIEDETSTLQTQMTTQHASVMAGIASSNTSLQTSLEAVKTNIEDLKSDIEDQHDIELDLLSQALASLNRNEDNVKRVLGLSMENYQIGSAIYDSKGNLTGAIITLFAEDSLTTEMATYEMVSTFNPVTNLLETYRVRRIS